mmetsp:Transcript_36045/g.55355  ORF Transcript_36045/g.55355 Transcript_36045/m.55355 type:complete len:88 (-) Transcript_36045:855-1118(-)
MEIVINGNQAEFILKFTLAERLYSISNISPISVSPVLKSELTFDLGETFPEALSEDLISVELSSITNPEKKTLRILDIDDVNKIFTA